MPTPSYIDIATKRQVILERLKSGEVADFTKEIKKIERLIRKSLLDLDEDLSELSRVQLNNLLALLQRDQGAIFATAIKKFLERTAEIAAVYMHQELLDLKRTVDVRGTRLNAFTNKGIFRKVIQRPLQTDGDLLKSWLKKFTDKEVQRTTNVVRRGHSTGKTNQEVVRELIGTKARNYKDGVLTTSRRNASTVVRTSVQHVASSARQEVWEANQDVVARYEFVATLDRVTSSICRSLDGQEFDFGKGPIPPLHPNCRSTTIPILNDKFSFLSKGRTRSSENGPVSANSEYYDWLKRQSKEDQDQVLGKKRAKLFRDGGLTIEKFRALQFDKNFAPLTLKEMKALEPEAFLKAGL